MWTKLVFSNLKAKDVTLFLLTFSLFPQDSAHICEDEPNTTKAQPKRLRSLDTFRGYVATIPCLSIHHHMRPIHMLILFRAVWGMMKIYSPSIMNNYRGHSLATGSPKLFFFFIRRYSFGHYVWYQCVLSLEQCVSVGQEWCMWLNLGSLLALIVAWG